MPTPRFFLRWSAGLLILTLSVASAPAQIPGHVDTGVRNYRSDGTTDQPFTLEVINAHRTVSNTMLLRLAITNQGTAPMAIQYDFSGNSNLAELGKISALYALDPNGRKKYEVLRDASGATLCSRIDPAINPGERRVVYAQVAAPPDTSSSFDLYFPQGGTHPHHSHRAAGGGRTHPAQCTRHRTEPGTGSGRPRAAGAVVGHRATHVQ